MCFSRKDEEKFEEHGRKITSVTVRTNRTQMEGKEGSKDEKDMAVGNSCKGILKSSKKGKIE